MASVTVGFGANERRDDEITASWIHEQIRAREREGAPVCARITVTGGGIDVALTAGDCGPAGGGGGRQPNSEERGVIDLWRKLHLGEATFSPGNLEAFVRQARRL
jgi:hypothetical protein